MSEWSAQIRVILEEMRNRSFVHFRDSGCWQPAVNIYEDEAAFHVCVSLAGMRREEINLRCQSDRRLVVMGERAQPAPAEAGAHVGVLAMEIESGQFVRELELPDAFAMDAVEATYRDGLLWIRLPKSNQI